MAGPPRAFFVLCVSSASHSSYKRIHPPETRTHAASCFARYEEEARSRRPGVTEAALQELRENLLNFSVSLVTDPDTFGIDA